MTSLTHVEPRAQALVASHGLTKEDLAWWHDEKGGSADPAVAVVEIGRAIMAKLGASSAEQAMRILRGHHRRMQRDATSRRRRPVARAASRARRARRTTRAVAGAAPPGDNGPPAPKPSARRGEGGAL